MVNRRNNTPEKKKKSFWEGKFWQWTKKNAPDVASTILSTAGDLTGVELLNRAGELIGGSSLPAEKKVEALELKQIELEMYRLEVADRASAREREVGMARAGKRDYFMYIVGGVGLLAFMLMVYAIIFMTIPDANKEIFINLLGIVQGVAMTIFAYYFGTSKSSREKQNILEEKIKE